MRYSALRGLNGWICSELESSAEQWRDCLGSACR